VRKKLLCDSSGQPHAVKPEITNLTSLTITQYTAVYTTRVITQRKVPLSRSTMRCFLGTGSSCSLGARRADPIPEHMGQSTWTREAAAPCAVETGTAASLYATRDQNVPRAPGEWDFLLRCVSLSVEVAAFYHSDGIVV